MTIIEQIKAEIERRIKIQDDWAGRKVLPGRDLAFAVKEELKRLLSFLSTLESEKPIIPNDLEEAAEAYSKKKHPMTITGAKESKEDFIAGAKWQKEQDDKLVDTIYQQGIEKGKDEMRELIKKENEK